MNFMRNEMFVESGQPLSGRLSADNISAFFRTSIGLNADLSNNLGLDYIRFGDQNNDGMLDKTGDALL